MADSQSQAPESSSFVKASYWYPGDYKTPHPQSPPTDIESSLFTHLFCAFADLDPNTHKVVVPESHEQEFSNFTEDVQKKNPDVQTLLSIGGKHADKSAFVSMVHDHRSRKSFIDSSIRIARSYGFNGLDLAWEYPSSSREMISFGTLLEEWRLAVEVESRHTGDPTLLLTAAVYYCPVYTSGSYPVYFEAHYPVQLIEENLDWVNIIAFDFYGSSTTIGPPAGLYNHPSKPEGPCGDSGLKQWIKAGLPDKKAVFGFPYFGQSWTLSNDKDHGADVAAATTGVAVSADGSINYDQIITFIKYHKAEPGHDQTVVGDYCFDGTTLIMYDDIESIVTKVRYTKKNGLLGYFAWNVGADDDSYLSRAASHTWGSNALTET
ncbi:PREDICTED: chitotriosidase-1-like [Camelina sativa]|uniref:Chitotriosidase-1-like n=1 Tax=Camelina sativa TaxID=90675 RepID=A0ABM0VFI4_CAMSA|nr:PREDICTED: chitotriosidase-1-like [Camelina sativa]